MRLSYIYVRGEIGVSLLLMALTVTASSKQACWVFITKKKERNGERAAAVTRQSRCTLKKKERNVHSESFVAYETGKMGHKETIASRGTKNVFLLLLLLFEFNYCARRLSFSLG